MKPRSSYLHKTTGNLVDVHKTKLAYIATSFAPKIKFYWKWEDLKIFPELQQSHFMNIRFRSLCRLSIIYKEDFIISIQISEKEISSLMLSAVIAILCSFSCQLRCWTLKLMLLKTFVTMCCCICVALGGSNPHTFGTKILLYVVCGVINFPYNNPLYNVLSFGISGLSDNGRNSLNTCTKSPQQEWCFLSMKNLQSQSLGAR